NPFARFSAEEEEDLRSIFLKPRYYDALKSNARQGNSRILVGQRGQGKSATIHMLFEDLKANKTLPLLITRYEGIPLANNKGFFLYKILQSLTKRLAEHLYRAPKDAKKLTKEQRNSLGRLVELFYDEEIAEDYLKEAKTIKSKKRANWFRRLFNSNLRLINSVVSGAIKITSSVVRESMGIPDADSDSTPSSIFEEMKLNEINSMSMKDVVEKGNDKLLAFIKLEIEIASALGYDSIVVLFDKIDEFADVNSDINKVADFTLPILTDTDLLYTNRLSIVFSLWSEVKRTLNNRGVRFDKFQDIDISWRDEELEQIIDKRLQFYSVNKNMAVTLKSLVPFDNDKKTILTLAGGSPRSLISLMSRLYDEETGAGNEGAIVSFSSATIAKGLVEFCKRFDYESLQPSKVSDKNNYYSWLNKVLLMKKPYFTLAEIANVFSIKSTTAQKYVSEMAKMGIITPDVVNDEEGNAIYRTVDPRICYLMTRGVTSLS
ncbi:MAG: hypothetical protein J5965_19065, partial [Aeriscardovia sp.]|nr:hypothetical protein [Aeriscardovia sp.]